MKAIRWHVLLTAAVDLSIGNCPTLYLKAGQGLHGEQLNGPLRIRMRAGSSLRRCRFGGGVQIDIEPSKKNPAIVESCIFEGQREGFVFPKPIGRAKRGGRG